jgi:hypothetical protein
VQEEASGQEGPGRGEGERRLGRKSRHGGPREQEEEEEGGEEEEEEGGPQQAAFEGASHAEEATARGTTGQQGSREVARQGSQEERKEGQRKEEEESLEEEDQEDWRKVQTPEERQPGEGHERFLEVDAVTQSVTCGTGGKSGVVWTESAT